MPVECAVWPDNETERDFLNFSGVAETVAEIIVQANSRPISIGVSGAWGIGKSSMIKLIRASLAARPKRQDEREFIFVEFNAWLYQDFDDARAALMDVIATKLESEAKAREKAVEKVKDLLSRIRWLRLAKLGAVVTGVGLALHAGVLPPPALLSEGLKDIGDAATGNVDVSKITDATKAIEGAASGAVGLIKPKAETSPPKEIQALRDAFEATLKDLDITLVVLIDDLDRCLPPTTIATLEAVRLFLFLKNTAFVIAADTDMIKFAVRQHFRGLEDNTAVTNYFDKLIQVPIQVPPLGTQEVRAYMMLLFVETSALPDEQKEMIRSSVCAQLQQSWQGKRVDRAFMQTLPVEFPNELIAKFDAADRLAPLMTTVEGIAGNPRLIKRFLNALAIRMAISKAHGVGVDEAVLAKLLLFERLATPAAYTELIAAVAASDTGRAEFIREWELKASAGEDPELEPAWSGPFVREWLALPPSIGDLDLRGALYVSREHTPLVTAADRLSSEGAGLLTALLGHPEVAAALYERLAQLQRSETPIIMERLLDRARQEVNWGAPGILEACLVLARADPTQSQRLAAFLSQRPVSQISPSIVPKIADQPWAAGVFAEWIAAGVSHPVKKAIKLQE